MKKLFFTAALLLIILGNIIAQNFSSVTVMTEDGTKFWVLINGIKQNDRPQTNVKIINLIASDYRFRIIFENRAIPSLDQDIMTKNIDNLYMDMIYVVSKNNLGVYVMRANSFQVAGGAIAPVDPKQFVTPLSLPDAMVAAVTTQTQPQVIIQTTHRDEGDKHHDYHHDHDADKPDHDKPVPKPDHYVMEGYNGPIGCKWPMLEADYNSAIQSISTKSFEEDKLIIAKQVLGSNCMTCEQIKGVMNVFGFEDSRLNFAKYAYGYVYDPGNFYKLNDVFTFSSSIDELNNYIKANKKY